MLNGLVDDLRFDESHHPLPPTPRRRSLLFASAPTGWRWAVGVRSALAFGLPALIVLAAGQRQQAMIVALGSFAVFYGEGRAYRVRWQVVLLAGASLLTAVAIGASVGGRVFELWAAGTDTAVLIDVAVLSVVALVATYIMVATRAGPPGMFFYDLLARCWGTPKGQLLTDPDQVARQIARVDESRSQLNSDR